MLQYTIDIRRSNRKTIGLEIKESGVLIVRVPRRMTNSMINKELARHQAWIEKHMLEFESRAEEAAVPKYSAAEIRSMADEALKVIPPRVKQYAELIGVSYGRITIRNQKTRWGSCSSKGNLNFNGLLTQVPEPVMDYVIVHELCHRLEMNHSAAFWAQVEKVLPDYKERRKWLKKNGSGVMQRMC